MTVRTAISPRLTDTAVYDHIIPARSPWSRIVRKGQALRIVDLEGQQAVDTLFYFADDPGERYCAQATLAALSNCPHPLSPGRDWLPQPVRAILWESPMHESKDLCRRSTEEAMRAFENTDAYLGG